MKNRLVAQLIQLWLKPYFAFTFFTADHFDTCTAPPEFLYHHQTPVIIVTNVIQKSPSIWTGLLKGSFMALQKKALLIFLFIRFIHTRSLTIKLSYRKPMLVLIVIFKHHRLGISSSSCSAANSASISSTSLSLSCYLLEAYTLVGLILSHFPQFLCRRTFEGSFDDVCESMPLDDVLHVFNIRTSVMMTIFCYSA